MHTLDLFLSVPVSFLKVYSIRLSTPARGCGAAKDGPRADEPGDCLLKFSCFLYGYLYFVFGRLYSSFMFSLWL